MIKELSKNQLDKMNLTEVKNQYAKLSQTYAKRLSVRWKENPEGAEMLYGERLTAKQMSKMFLLEKGEQTEKEKYVDAYSRMVENFSGVTTKAGFEEGLEELESDMAAEMDRIRQRDEIDFYGLDLWEEKRSIKDREDFYNWSDRVEKARPETDKSMISRILHNNENSTRAVLEDLYNKLQTGRR